MTDPTAQSVRPADREPFVAVLTPHRSLSRTGFVVLMAGLGVVSFIAGMAFVAIGAWPVLGFFGLDVVLVYWAFRVNYRDARAYETVEVGGDTFTLTRVDAKGRASRVTLNPYWARVRLAEAADGSTRLSIVSHGVAHPVGACLSDDERREFAGVLDGALRRAQAATG